MTNFSVQKKIDWLEAGYFWFVALPIFQFSMFAILIHGFFYADKEYFVGNVFAIIIFIIGLVFAIYSYTCLTKDIKKLKSE